MSNTNALPVVVLVSGRGSNLQALINAQARGELAGAIRAVVSNRADAYALTRAREAGITAEALEPRRFPDRASYDRELLTRIEVYRPGLIAMAGFMRILSPEFIACFAGRMLNIHPSLLPAFRGLNTHRRALAARVAQHGCSVHFVTNELDAGPVVAQARMRVAPDDDEEMLAARVLRREHIIYPRTVRWFCEGRLTFANGAAWLDGSPLVRPVMLTEYQCEF
ncbi:MAG: phosphoribosylglycinamide formyltransferase [Gammaproteobacteria bacterium]|nr:phosphoribosylglycinamide formyltransferase [Gammaproteobacteria bacterium]